MFQVFCGAWSRDSLPRHDFTHEDGAVLEGQFGHRPRPEEAQPVTQDEDDHPDDHQHADTEPGAGQPDGGIAATEELPRGAHHTALYRSRNRWRMTSAIVFTRNVIMNSSAAARNNVRYKVPP